MYVKTHTLFYQLLYHESSQKTYGLSNPLLLIPWNHFFFVTKTVIVTNVAQIRPTSAQITCTDTSNLSRWRMFDKSNNFFFIASNLLKFHGIYITPDSSKEVNATTLSVIHLTDHLAKMSRLSAEHKCINLTCYKWL